MLKSSLIAFAAIAFACSMHAVPAQAQRVFVSATGSDGNPCTFASPCRTFQHAHDTVAAGGEIDVLDPAGYGALTITKAISIQGHGFAGISVGSSGDGISINAGPGDLVNLTGLIIQGSGGNLVRDGIVITSVGSLSVENCIIRYVGNGIAFIGSSLLLSVSDTFIADSNSSGIEIQPSGGAYATFNRVRAYHNAAGFNLDTSQFATGLITAIATDCEAVENYNGFSVSGTTTNVAELTLVRSVAANNTNAGVAVGGAILVLAQSAIHGNYQSWEAGYGFLLSFGDNYVYANTTSTGTPVTISKQ